MALRGASRRTGKAERCNPAETEPVELGASQIGKEEKPDPFLGLDLNFYGKITARSSYFSRIINRSPALPNFESNWFKMNYS
ncbi:hypothetical protein AXF42_Ash006432 [Apostasia shenzhenica]|uniref:Uncharacterized protein n=1 Tax=Apostasia shenzhenica TaxID=1088818 RepID=A0A2I0AZ33_9ASPA|nr:hypothetical protein AXF42_Ash006432 [Apostasia shenzhenica]